MDTKIFPEVGLNLFSKKKFKRSDKSVRKKFIMELRQKIEKTIVKRRVAFSASMDIGDTF